LRSSPRMAWSNAGGNVVDQEVVTDQNITSSRWPDDLPAFCARIVEQFAAGRIPTNRPGKPTTT
jgi:protease I